MLSATATASNSGEPGRPVAPAPMPYATHGHSGSEGWARLTHSGSDAVRRARSSRLGYRRSRAGRQPYSRTGRENRPRMMALGHHLSSSGSTASARSGNRSSTRPIAASPSTLASAAPMQ